MKPASLLLLFTVAFGLLGCNTLATRRDLYSPKRGSGYWTNRYHGVPNPEGTPGVPHPAEPKPQ